MSKFLFFVIWLAGAIVAAVIVISSARKAGSLHLDDFLIGTITCLSSFFGIVFLGLFHLAQIVADKFDNPVIWHRNQDE